MELDVRLHRLATGISAREAARALARSLAPGERLSELERDQAGEFAATIEAMFLMAAVDGEISEVELVQLEHSIATIMDPGTAHQIQLDQLLEEFDAKLERDGWKARLDDVAQRILTAEGKELAFRLAAGVAFVDDHVEQTEAAAIDAFASAVGLCAEDSQALLRQVYADLFGER